VDSGYVMTTLKKTSWTKKLQAIKEQYPSVETVDWFGAFTEDIDLFGRVIRDILKQESASPHHSGPRPALDYDTAKQRLAQIMGRDYSVDPFPLAFKTLAAGRSVRHLALKTSLNRNMIYRLLSGHIDPDNATMEIVASAFGKNPSYFLEYRINGIMVALEGNMMKAPEITIDLYRKIFIKRDS
jgi:DNA-binding phage protein